MGVKFYTGSLTAVLNTITSRIEDKAIKKLESSAIKVQELAVEYAPVDEGNLEDSIKVSNTESSGGDTVVDVFVDGDVPSSDGGKVSDYANKIHEGRFKQLGPKSQQKAASSGKAVGPKFLERAGEELTEEIFAEIFNEVRKNIK
jgi:hypothetical protein